MLFGKGMQIYECFEENFNIVCHEKCKKGRLKAFRRPLEP